MNITRIFKRFLQIGNLGSLLLLFFFIIAIFIENSSYSQKFNQFINTNFLGLSITNWINEALMTLFFLQVGLEIKREIVEGELSDIKVAGLPIFGAIGGMLIPALIYYSFTYNTNYSSGFGIPMATDIAISLAIINLFGKSIPLPLKIFLAALAIIDDLGAIIIIALFYTKQFEWLYLVLAFILIIITIILSYKKNTNLLIYFSLIILLWLALHQCGIHPSIAGAVIALCFPFKQYKNEEKIMIPLHKIVTYFIVPIFILVNALINIKNINLLNLNNNYSLGIFFGLTIGKPLGILFFVWLSVKLKWAKLSNQLNYKYIIGAGIIAGIGFTMSIFISLLSFNNPAELNTAKLIITLAGLTSIVLATVYFKLISRS
jgi:NhaA family Na+:H+ antiporter